MDDYDSKLQELHNRFRQQLPERLDSCLSAWDGYQKTEDDEELNQLRFHTHKLAGAASIYGFDNIGDSARSIELLVDQYYSGDINNFDTLQEKISPQLDQLEKLILAAKTSAS